MPENRDLDVFLIWLGTETHQPNDATNDQEDKRRNHTRHPGRHASSLLRTLIMNLHPTGRRDRGIFPIALEGLPEALTHLAACEAMAAADEDLATLIDHSSGPGCQYGRYTRA
jgi:hypothetical protein